LNTTSPSDSGWKETLAPYSAASWSQGTLAVVTSLLPYLALTVAMYLLLSVSVWLTIALMVPAAAFLVRTFVIFHDCTHGSLFPSRRANTIVGGVLGLFVLTPFSAWRHEHAVHHGTAGDLDRRGVGDVETLTVDEYNDLPLSGRFAYRAFRNPAIMFTIGPIVAMIIGPRIASRTMRPRLRNSVLVMDAALVVAMGLLVWAVGPIDLLIILLPVAMIAGAGGIWLFYVQHQFEDVYWQRHESWSYFEAALQGCSFLDLPAIGHFFSANIGYHHLHHLNARIPHYNLPAAHRADPRFAQVPTLSVRQGLQCTRFKLFDERVGKMVTFGQARSYAAPAPVGSVA
jgi:omega-6 fatty acid desaturase (delta-12 desaturase)